MNKPHLIGYGMLSLLALLLGAGYYSATTSLKGKLRETEAKLDSVEAARKAVEADRARLDKENAALTAEKDRLKSDLSARDAAVAKLGDDLAKLNALLNDDQSVFARIQPDDDSVTRFKKGFPAFAPGTHLIAREESSPQEPGKKATVPYGLLPAGAIDELGALKAKSDGLAQELAKKDDEIATLMKTHAPLEESIRMAKEKEAALAAANEKLTGDYGTLQSNFDALNKKYQDEMAKKHVSLKTSILETTGALGGGLLLGLVL
jgi:septal ring factor EnvC (AmiA/AmiB activator)